jgi:CRISPR/Cas system CSM-associated protein Csm2 small subunit
MNENEQDPMNAPPAAGGESGAVPAAPVSEGGESQAEGGAPSEGGEHAAGPGGEGAPGGGRGERRRKKGRGERGKGGPGGGPPRGQGGPPHGGHPGPRYVEDRIDLDAEHLARESRAISTDRVRPLALMTANVRRLLASPDAHDRREARRVLVLFKSRIAFLAGREFGRERNAFVRVRDFVLHGIEAVTRDREQLDPLQVRNFLDHVDAFVGYHRFHSDDRRRD